MDEITRYKTYQEYKAELDGELQKTAESFVKIGYLLKVARDTNILEESGYKTVAEFAAAEYNLDKTQVSRFISINDKFSESGYSDHLLPEYKGYGYAKLTIMLQLPTAINEELTPRYSKSDIQAIRDEVVAEAQVTDIERIIEGQNEDDPLISQVIYWLGKANPVLYLQIGAQMTSESWTIEDIKELMAPSQEATYSVRIPGGRYMLMLSEEGGSIVNVRTGEKEAAGWGTIGQQWKAIAGTESDWEKLYGEQIPKKTEVAPVQQRKEPKVVKAVEPKKSVDENTELIEQSLHDVEPSIPEPDPIPEPEHVSEEDVEVIEPDIPGQDTIENHEEWMPDDNQIRGYRTAVTNKLKQLSNLWNGEQPEKVPLMLEVMEDLKWDLEKLKEKE
nr:MAG TPA: Protein of unknown function (DUF3102) [Bacteriophage sp.]